MTRQISTQTQQQTATNSSLSRGILQRQCVSCGQHTIAGGECSECQKKRLGFTHASRSPLQRRAANQEEPSEVPSIVYEVLNSPGQLLDAATRAFMEPRFGHDFSQVRVHTDVKAAESAQAVNALAYTVGQNVAFGAGQYAPSTDAGKRLLAHELTHVIQNRHTAAARSALQEIDIPSSPAEVEADQVSHRLQSGLPVGGIVQSNTGIARTTTSTAITPLISYSATDWEVTAADEAAVLARLRVDPDLSATIVDLNSAGMLDELIDRVDENANRRELLQILGSRLNSTARALVETHVARLEQQWQLQFNLGRLGVTTAAPAFSRTSFASLISSDPSRPFTGVGASGVNPTTLDIPYVDQARLAADHSATVARYSNPIPGSLAGYLATLTPAQRSQQAELLLRQPISTVEAASYAGNIPSRAQIIRAAATAHNLHPQMIAAFLLAEQRDQSRNEDAKDYLGATSILSGNTSIGLGQVVISTARRHDLFADLLATGTRSALDHDQIATLLASDEFNIFAAARYIRRVANDGSTRSTATLPRTLARFPSMNLVAYASNSSTWPDDNIRVLGMYYTSSAWTDDLRSAGWGDFVFEAYQDVIASGVF